MQTAQGKSLALACKEAQIVIGQGVVRAVVRTPAAEQSDEIRPWGPIPSPSELPKPGERLIRTLESATAPFYEPQTKAGEFARTAAEFVPESGKKLGQVIALGVIPSLASERAGQATKGSVLETPARIGAGVIAGLGGAAFRAPSNVL